MNDLYDEEMEELAGRPQQELSESPSSARVARERKATEFYKTTESSSPAAHGARTASQQKGKARHQAKRAANEEMRFENERLTQKVRRLEAEARERNSGAVEAIVVPREKVYLELSDTDSAEDIALMLVPRPASAAQPPTRSDVDTPKKRKPAVRNEFRGCKKSASTKVAAVEAVGEPYTAAQKGKGKMRASEEGRGVIRSGGTATETLVIEETDDEREDPPICTTPEDDDDIYFRAIREFPELDTKDRHKSHQHSSRPFALNVAFVVASHIPRRTPLSQMRPEDNGSSKERKLSNTKSRGVRDGEVERRIEVQRMLSVPSKGSHDVQYRLETITRQIPDEQRLARCVEFFPFSHIKGLEYMEGVFASCLGNKVGIFRINSDDDGLATDDKRDGSRISVVTLQTLESPTPQEDYHSLSWSIECSSSPFVPILAVAGEAAVINVYRNEISKVMESNFVLDRTITGHGRRINHLTFAKHHPHILITASEDATICFWDVTLPWGSDSAVIKSMKYLEGPRWGNREHFVERPRVVGELLAKVIIGGHVEGVLSCDLHSELPLLVSSGTDGAIKVFEIPSSILLGPNLSTMTALPPPRKPSKITPIAPSTLSHEVLILGPPIFSSTLVHAGVWVDQVRWKSSGGTEIISKASKIHSESPTRPQTSIKTFQPKVLDLFTRAEEEEEGVTIRVMWRRKKEAVGEFAPAIKDCAALAFDTRKEISIEGTNCIGASFGHHKGDAGNLTILRSLLDNSAYFFADFSASFASPRTLATMETTFPDSREPFEFDFWPRQLPDSITHLGERLEGAGGQEEGSEGVVWRDFGVSREGKWVVAVGDNRSVAIWRRCEV